MLQITEAMRNSTENIYQQKVSIENLYMISRSEQLKKENSLYARYPEDVQYLIKLKGALNRQINKATKKNES